MAQPTSKILTADMLENADFRQQFVEVATHADDFASGETSLILSTVPFLSPGDTFSDIPLYPVGLTQNFSWNEGLSGQFVPEMGSSRKIGVSGNAMGSGSISRLVLHGNSLVAALYRPTIEFIATCDTLKDITDRISGDSAKKWILGLSMQGGDIMNSDLTDYVDHVIAQGGMNSLLYKIPFGMIEVQRDPRQRVVGINFLEQCNLRGNQKGLSANQFQLIDSMSFEFERVRPLKGVGPFSLSSDTLVGM